MNHLKVDKLLECYRRIKLSEDGMMGGGDLPTNNASSGKIAGLPPDDPPVDKKRKKTLKMFTRGGTGGRKGS